MNKNISAGKINISAVVIAKNEEKKIKDCLASLSWVDEVVVINNNSTDKTANIAEKFGARVVNLTQGSYSELRNKGLEVAKHDWILYIDADERATPDLKNEITSLIQKIQKNKDKRSRTYFAVPRRNIIFGKEMSHGGWWPDYVKRLYLKKFLKGWQGIIIDKKTLLLVFFILLLRITEHGIG